MTALESSPILLSLTSIIENGGWWKLARDHDLRNHILPRSMRFQPGNIAVTYPSPISTGPELDADRLTEMMLGEPPNVIVIADSPAVAHIWRPALREISVALGVVEPFRGPGNELILRLNGDQPEPPGEILTR